MNLDLARWQITFTSLNLSGTTAANELTAHSPPGRRSRCRTRLAGTGGVA
jgi:hypothetical protein